MPGVTTQAWYWEVGALRLVDTPGIDAGHQEERWALEYAKSAKCLLWCHALRMGEFRPTELSALRKLMPLQHTMFVLTQADNLGSSPEENRLIAVEIAARVAEQLAHDLALRIRPPRGSETVFLDNRSQSAEIAIVGSVLYHRAPSGSRGDRARDLSGIPRLRKTLEHLARTTK